MMTLFVTLTMPLMYCVMHEATCLKLDMSVGREMMSIWRGLWWSGLEPDQLTLADTEATGPKTVRTG